MPVPAVRWAVGILLVALVLAVYGPSVSGEFLNWDDPEHIIENPRVTAPDGLVRSWRETGPPGFYPITYATFFLEWRAGGGAPWLFHLDNVLLHAANMLLAGRLALAAGLPWTASWLAAALWALHPVGVASVAWATERKNVLYVLFWLSALLLYLGFADRRAVGAPRPWTPYVFSLVLFGLALLSKGAALSLPATIVAIEWARGRALDRRFWLALLPYVAVALAGGLTLVGAVPPDVVVPPLGTRLLRAARASWFYVATFLWPHGLLPVYARWPAPRIGSAEYLAAAAAIAVTAGAIVLGRRAPRLLWVGVGLFLTNVVFVVGIVWFTYLRYAWVADHLAYLPTLGLALTAVVAVRELGRALGVPERGSTAALAAWCGILGIATSLQVRPWHDSEGLWRYTLARNPDCFVCHSNLGFLLAERGEIDSAVAHYEQALVLQPDFKTALNFGNARVAQGRDEEAATLYDRAARLDPEDARAPYNLGNALRRLGRTEEAIAAYRQALRLKPGWIEAQNNLGIALHDAGRLDEAAEAFREAHRLDPADVDAELNLALVASDRQDWQAVIDHCTSALGRTRDGPRYAAAHRMLAEALAHAGRSDEALAHYEVARRQRPDPSLADHLATTLAEEGRIGEAVRVLEEALAQSPDAAALANSLAWIRATSPQREWRDAGQAVRLAERACELTGYEDPNSLDTLGAAYAEAGRFADAVRTGERALAAADDEELAGQIRSRLALYRTGRPYSAQ